MDELVKFLRAKITELKETTTYLRDDLDDAEEENIRLRVENAELQKKILELRGKPMLGVGYPIGTTYGRSNT